MLTPTQLKKYLSLSTIKNKKDAIDELVKCYQVIEKNEKRLEKDEDKILSMKWKIKQFKTDLVELEKQKENTLQLLKVCNDVILYLIEAYEIEKEEVPYKFEDLDE